MKYIILKNGTRTDKCLSCHRLWHSDDTIGVSHSAKGLCRGCSRKKEYSILEFTTGQQDWKNDLIPETLLKLVLPNQKIDVFKLSKGSAKKILHKCDVCSKSKETEFKLFIRGKNLSHTEDCRIKKRQSTDIVKYGVINHLNTPHIVEARNQKANILITESFGKEKYKVNRIIREKQEIIVHFYCNSGHDHQITYAAWQNGQRCGQCLGNGHKVTFDIVTKSFANSEYKLLTDHYDNNMQSLDFICNKGHKGSTYWKVWTRGIRCARCPNFNSKPEQEIRDVFQEFEPIKDREILEGKELDLYFSNYNLAIEHCGLYWHSDKHDRITVSYHYDKMIKCRIKGIRLITIFGDEWLNKKEICESRIRQALGVTQIKLDARNCFIKIIPKDLAASFLNKNHIDGCPTNFSVAFGLFSEDGLVSVMTGGSPSRAHTSGGKKVLELKRFASLLDYSVRGGASKLFALFKTYAIENSYQEIHTYCDMRWGTGNVYEKLGFKLVNISKYTPHYTDGNRRWRNQAFANDSKGSESKKTTDKNLYKIYDCGHQTWKLVLDTSLGLTI